MQPLGVANVAATPSSLQYDAVVAPLPRFAQRGAVMSSDVIARVDAFAKKALELSNKGHILRAAENFGRAAEAARALGADNLVALHMQLQQCNMVAVYAQAVLDVTGADPRALAAHRAECIALLSGAVEALERRRVAGTLLEGKCAPSEEAWRASEAQQIDARVSADEAASWATLVGYEEYLRAAANLTDVLVRARTFAAECSAAQFQSFAGHVVHATEMMQQPRRHSDMTLSIETNFTKAFFQAVDLAGANGLDARLVQLLEAAWQRLQHSGVLQARRMDECIRLKAPETHAFHAAIQESLSAPGLRTCALEGCSAKEAHPAHFKSCAACRRPVYCCREHQVAGWPSHKKGCKAARKAAAAEDEAGPSGT